MIILIGGGSRSGKSRFALDSAKSRGHRLAFIATAQLFDPEMRKRAAMHQAERGDAFVTFDQPFDVGRKIDELREYHAIVVDCLTLWLSNLMLSGAHDVAAETASLVEAARTSPAAVVFVTNEVGCGIVPENELARRFRDEAGKLNQQIAAAAESVFWMAFGYPIRVK